MFKIVKMFKALEDVQGVGRCSRRWKMFKIVKMFTDFTENNDLNALKIFQEPSQALEDSSTSPVH